MPRISAFYGHFRAIYDSAVAMSTRAACVVSAEPLDRFVLRLRFNDRIEREVDLENVLWGPVFEPLRINPDLFRQVRVDDELGTIVWPNGADMDPDVLHGDFKPAESAPNSDASRPGR